MSVLQHPETISSKDVQVWNNAAFDDCSSSVNLSIQSVHSDLNSKENHHTPSSDFESPVSTKSLASNHPLQVNNVVANCPVMAKIGVLEKKSLVVREQDCVGKENGGGEERNLDAKIAEIEKEISRLSSRLEELRLEKVKRNAKIMEKKGRIVAAKFMDPPKQGIRRSSDEERKIEESKLKTPRRGVSLGPAEIMRGARKGVGVGRPEIYSATKLKQFGKPEITQAQSSVNRRKSCYWKLQDIDELRGVKEKGKCRSVSPKPLSKTVVKAQVPKQAATTIGCKKMVKKDDRVISSIQPKKLFMKDGEKSGAVKKPLKSGRVVTSRYNQMITGGSSALRKRSLPENEEDVKRSRLSLVPKVKTLRCIDESPRDSGAAKRVSELVGRKSFFSMGNGDEADDNVCQTLSFEEEKVIRDCPRIKVLRCSSESPRDSGAAKRVSQLVGRKPYFANDDEEMPVFSFEDEDVEE